ncbi:biosynthetic arginine decarboxylase [soil metagenome]
MKRTLETSRFTEADAAELYGIPYWSSGYFHVKDGLVHVRPATRSSGDNGNGRGDNVALRRIIDDLVSSGHALPLILRFPQIIENRLEQLNRAFERAIQKFDYGAHYQGVFPIKVNQRRVVVETIAEYGARFKTGLEAGSKAELALCLVQDIHPESLLCCNGFKDDDFIRLALRGRLIGKNVVITLEKYSELHRVLRLSKELGVKPALGVRFKLHAKGSGQWETSGGDDAKFGLNATELINVVETLRERDMLDSLVMLHCHIGSQITDIRKIKVAVREAAQAYVEVREMGVPMRYLNVGGGLAVDYDGSKTTFYVSANYGLQEYADDVVYSILETCAETGTPHPVIVTESGRALTAHHSVVVLPVIDAIGPSREPLRLPEPGEGAHALVHEMVDLLRTVSVKNYREIYHDAVGYKDTMHNLFDLGYLTLLDRAHIENLFNQVLVKIARVIKDIDYVPEEFGTLPRLLADKYVCNFSLFQSLPDHWAIQALFPVMPLGRLDEEPSRDATLVDISCDSDGKMTKFVDLRDVKDTLRLHNLRTHEPYYLGIFLTGAYQDVLANAHNLFGRVNEAHVRVTGDGQYELERFVRGQKARRVIENMGYEASDLHRWIGQEADEARGRGTLSEEQARDLIENYDAELVGYTYLEE